MCCQGAPPAEIGTNEPTVSLSPTVTPQPTETPTFTPQPSISRMPTSSDMCEANAVCNELGLEGSCCPTTAGMFLACCDGMVVEESCDLNPTCAGMVGRRNCYRIYAGVPGIIFSPQCSFFPKQGLEGACCPTSDGFGYLDCCDVVPDEDVQSTLSYLEFLENGGASGASTAIMSTGLLLAAASLLLAIA